MTANAIGPGTAPRETEEMIETALVNTTEGIEAVFEETALLDGLRRVGIEAGDTLFVQVSLDSLGRPKACTTEDEAWPMLLRTLQTAVGREGTILVPTYTFSFCRQEDFDVGATPTAGGPWSASAGFLEFVRRAPGAVRSRDPIHSVAGLGPRAEELLLDVPTTCFGPGSVHERLLRGGGKVCTIGVGLHEATFRHFVEEMVGVPFRYKKLFTGRIRENGVVRKTGWIYNVRILADNGCPDGTRLETRARVTGLCRAVRVGAGEVSAISCRDLFDLTEAALAEDCWTTARGPSGNPVALEEARVSIRPFDVRLSPDSSIGQIVDALWQLPRDIISDGYDAGLRALGDVLPMTVHEFPSGTECWSWIVPEKWTCHEAYLETLDGRRLFSYADHPLHVASYSLPFEGVVSREELDAHLHVHGKIPDAVPFIFKYYERDWGLCCSRKQKEELRDDRYRVVIRTDFSYGTLKVGEVLIPGQSNETFVLCAHLCHPGMFNDDMSGVAVSVAVARELLRRPKRRYSYLLLIVPETIGSVAYLSRHADIIPKLKGGLFLEMLGSPYPHALQLSFSGKTQVDRSLALALKGFDSEGWTGPFRSIIGNDERQFNGPGVRVPMLSLSRVDPSTPSAWPYPQYHSSHDVPDAASIDRLAVSRDLVLKMVDALEGNRIPVNRFQGEVFCSRYGIHIDPLSNPEGSRSLFDVMFLIDGTRSIADIASACGVSFESVRQTVEELARHGLIDYREGGGSD